MRQWVLTVPYRLRYQMAWDHGLSRAVLRVYTRVLLDLYARGPHVRRAGWTHRQRHRQGHGQSRTVKNSIVGKYGVDFTPSNEMWGYAQCAVGMPEPVFTENSEGLVHLKTLQGAFTR